VTTKKAVSVTALLTEKNMSNKENNYKIHRFIQYT